MVPVRRSILTLALVANASATSLGLTRARLLRGACAAAALPCAVEIYSRAPPRWSLGDLPALTVPADVDRVCVVVPGSGGPDANTARIAASLRGQRTAVV
eukprot:1283764-Prymnesium_polylepis.1